MATNYNQDIETSLLITFAQGYLSPGAAAKVREALANDETLRWEYEGILKIMEENPGRDPEEVLDEMVAGFNRRLGEREAQPQIKQPKVIPLWRRPAAVAASVVLLISLAFAAKYLIDQQDPKQLAASYFSVKFTDNARSDETPAPWLVQYNRSNYQEVIALLGAQSNLSQQQKLYLGLSYSYLNPPQFAKGIEILKDAASSGEQYKRDALLYLGIIEILNNENDAATKTLQEISKNDQAAELLERLK